MFAFDFSHFFFGFSFWNVVMYIYFYGHSNWTSKCYRKFPLTVDVKKEHLAQDFCVYFLSMQYAQVSKNVVLAKSL